jgi:AcrR family transcriptional regulator
MPPGFEQGGIELRRAPVATMARPKAADHDQHRDHILHQAVECFAQHGYASASMAQIALRCGLSKAGLYHYYTQKERLLFDALDRYTRRLIVLCDEVDANTTPHNRLAQLIRSFVQEYQTSRSYHVALLTDLKFLNAEQANLIKDQQRYVVEKFAVLVRQLDPSTQALKPTTMALMGMMNFMFAWYRPDAGLAPEAFSELLLQMWLRALQAPPLPA